MKRFLQGSLICWLVGLSVMVVGLRHSSAEALTIIGAHSPSLSPDSLTVIFTYQGDVWEAPSVGGVARRLTVHDSDDFAPVYSPDGKWIAFSSTRTGRADVYLMSAEGSEPRRLTYHSSDDVVIAFSPDSQYVFFESGRDWLADAIWRVAIMGGEPEQVLKEECSAGRLSPDGTYLAAHIGYFDIYRKGYRGHANSDLWLRSMQSGELTQLTDFPGTDAAPLWAPDGQSLYFLSDREYDALNIWELTLATKAVKPVTTLSSGLLYDAELNRTGDRFVFVHEHKIKTCGLDGVITEIPVQTAADYRSEKIEKLSFNDLADEVAFTAPGEEAVFSYHGELFAVGKKGGEARRLTQTAARESAPRWRLNGSEVFFISDRTGTPGIYSVKSTDAPEQRLSKARFFETRPIVTPEKPVTQFVVTPDEKSLVYVVKEDGLSISDLKGTNPRLLLKDDAIDSLTCSPDGRWVAYAKSAYENEWDVFVLRLATGEEYNLTKMVGEEYNPQFSPDGKRLTFMWTFENQTDLYYVWLTKKEHELYREDLEEDPKASKPAGAKDSLPDKAAAKDKAEPKPEPPEVVIDVDRIWERCQPLIATQDYDKQGMVSPDGKRVVFTANPLGKWGVYLYEEKTKDFKKLADIEPRSLTWTTKGDSVCYFGTDRRFGTIDPETGVVSPISFSATMEVNTQNEFAQMYRETWNCIKYYFYDQTFHGADWDMAYQLYLPLLEHARSTREFHHVVRLLTSELNASHLGIWKNGGREVEETGCLGVRLGAFKPGLGYLIQDVVPGSPADRVASKLKSGEYLYAINRVVIDPLVPIASQLNQTVGKLTDLEVKSSSPKPVTRTVSLKPISGGDYHALAYQQWVERNRALVDSLSNNRIGYVHISSMSRHALRTFDRETFAQYYEKEALLIDVRYNPGGYIHNELIGLLTGDLFGYYQERNQPKMPQPGHVWRKPSALVINQHSFSDAEVFPNAYQILKIGKVIGMPTFGGVIGTGGISLLDGSWFRVPSTGWFTRDGVNMENTGAFPDIISKQHPSESWQGKDSQLATAVQTLLEELGVSASGLQ